jgi:plastocyanin
MKKSWLCLATISVFLSFALLACGNKQGNSQASSTPSATSGVAVDPATAGSISGTVELDGAAPRMKPINMAAEPACAKQHATPVTSQEVLVGKDGALENVVVYLKGDFSKYKFDAPQAAATMTQKGCMYDPHVVVLETGQSLQVVNADPVTHNIHPLPKDNREWNESQPPGAPAINQSFPHEEIAIPVKCNIHPWMKGYIAVFDHPYFTVTGKDGAFDLKNVPPGDYTLVAWHELYGTSEQPVTIGAKESKMLRIAFHAASAAHGS